MRQQSQDGWAVQLVLQVFLIGVGLLIALPILFVIVGSFTPNSDLLSYPPEIIPSRWTLENYVSAWDSQPILRYFVNSSIQTGIIVTFQTLLSILAAFAFSTLKFPGRDILFYVVVGSLMIPLQLTWIPNFVLISELGWGNTYAALTVPFLASGFGVFFLRQFFLTLPKDYYDAARLDGASSWQYLWEVVVPLNRGAIATFVIFSFLSAWNQYMWPLVVTNTVEMRTLQVGVRFLVANIEEGQDWAEVLAVTVMVFTPTLIAFIAAQRSLVESIASTGLRD